MTLVQLAAGLGWWTAIALPAFLIVLTLIVFVHEFGHFLMGRIFGVRIESFSIGFGRAIVGFQDRHGTMWKVGWLPLGGYVKFWGDAGVSSNPDHDVIDQASADERAHSFHHKPLLQKALIAVAGPLANFILAIVIFSAVYMIYGREFTAAIVDAVKAGTPAEAAGFKAGDRVLSIDGTHIKYFDDLVQIVSLNQDTDLIFVVQRGSEIVTLHVVPKILDMPNPLGGKDIPATGIGLEHFGDRHKAEAEYVRYGPLTAVAKGAGDTWFIVAKTLDFVGRLLTGSGDVRQLSGPIGIAQVSGQILDKAGPSALVWLMAVLSVSIGLLNLFPIPMLDGGHLLYYGIEAVRGRPLGEKAQELGFQIGLALVVGLMLIATWNDLQFRLF